MSDSCCAPERDGPTGAQRQHPAPPSGGPVPSTLVDIPGGRYRIGDDSAWSYPGDGESPVHEVELRAFRMGRHAVTNGEFATFVDATGWRTEAETFAWSFVFGGLLPDEFPRPGGSRGHRGGAR